MLIHIAEVKCGLVHVPGDGLGGDHHRGRHKAAFGADLNPVRTFGGRIGHASRPVGRKACHSGGGNHFDFGIRSSVCGGHGRIGHIKLQVEEPVVGNAQDAESVGFRLHFHVRVGGAVDHRGIHEGLAHHGWIGGSRPLQQLQGALMGS